MSDAEVMGKVLDIVGSDVDWTMSSLAATLASAGWEPGGRVREPFPTWWSLGGVDSNLVDMEGEVFWELTFEQWDPDEYPDLDHDGLENLARPRIDALRDLFEQHADSDWAPGEIPPNEDSYPLGYHHGWHSARLSVEIGSLMQDSGLPLCTVIRIYNHPKS